MLGIQDCPPQLFTLQTQDEWGSYSCKQECQEDHPEDGCHLQDWHKILAFALHGYRTSVRTSKGENHLSLVYGMDAVLPIEVEIPSLCVIMEAELSNA